MQFAVAAEPRLHLRMLCGKRNNASSPGSTRAASTYHFLWARNAIYHALAALGVSPGESILVPAYHCATAIEPVLRYGSQPTFYRVRRDCVADLDDIRNRLTRETRAILAIHYFGFPQPIAELHQMCEEHGLYLIEDCAHVLAGRTEGGALGTFGDISVFSWRKFLPIYDGGALVVNNPGLSIEVPWDKPNLNFRIKVAKNVLDKLIDDSGSDALKALSSLFYLPYRVSRDALRRRGHDITGAAVDTHSIEFDLATVNLGMSAVSRRICERTDFSSVVNRRRENYVALRDQLASQFGIDPYFSELPAGVCPWVYPVLFRGRTNVHKALRRFGIPAFTWDGVIHPALPIDEFPDAAYLFKNLVLLPIHQDIDEADLRAIVNGVRRALERKER